MDSGRNRTRERHPWEEPVERVSSPSPNLSFSFLPTSAHQLVVDVQRANYENVEPDSQEIEWTRRKAGASWGCLHAM